MPLGPATRNISRSEGSTTPNDDSTVAPPPRPALSLRWCLFTSFVALVAAVFVSVIALSLHGTDRLLHEVPKTVLAGAQDRTDAVLRRLFDPIVARIAVDHGLIRSGQVRPYDDAALLAQFRPAMYQLPQSGSMMVSDESGYQFLIMKYDELVLASPLVAPVRGSLPAPAPDRLQFVTRDVRPAEWGDDSRWTVWAPDGHNVLHSWHQRLPDYDPKSRPWFVRALANYRDRTDDAVRANPREAVAWTEPCVLFTSKTPGLSASLAARDPEGRLVIVAYDLLLDDLSRFTAGHRPTPRGQVFVLDDRERVVGLPGSRSLATADARAAALLATTEDAGVPEMAEAFRVWRAAGKPEGTPVRFVQVGDGWWTSFRPFEIGSGARFWVGAILPESDFLAEARAERDTLVTVGVIALCVASIIALALASGFARPLRELVMQSRRMAALDLSPGRPTTSRVKELHTLSQSLEALRGALARHAAERDAAAASLRHSEARFRTLFDHAGDAILLLDLEGNVLDANETACRTLQYAREELGARTLTALDAEWTRERIDELVEHLVPGRESTALGRHARRDGTTVDVEMQFALIELEERPLLLVHVRDVTRRRELEERLVQSQKMEAVGRLAGGIAHDFNNVLTAILGHVQLGRRDLSPDDPRTAHFVSAEQAAERAAEMTRQLLAFTRKQIVAPRVLTPDAVLRRVEPMLRRLIGEDIALETEYADPTWPVRVDPARLEQVVLNLAVNARDAMPDGGRLELRTRNVPGRTRAEDRVEVEVTDHGTGMTDDVRSRIFEPYFTTKPVGKGTGLGLSTSYGIVEQSGGHLRVRSAPGEGSTFVVELPRADDAPADGVRIDPVGSATTGHETVLLVEDDRLVRSLAEQVLTDRGYRVLVAADGQEGFEVASAFDGAIDVLLTDVIMPRLSGPELAARLTAARPALRVVYMSGYSDHPAVQREAESSPHAFLAKPFSPSALAGAVRRAIDGGPDPAAP